MKRDAQMIRASLIAFASGALLLGGCGDDGDDPRDYTLGQVVSRPPLPGELVGVIGEVRPLGDLGFVLTGEGGAIVVIGDAEEADSGERVRVVGVVDRLTREQATRVANRLGGTPDVRARTNRGALYLALERVEPAS